MATQLTGIDNINFDKLSTTDLFGGSGKMQIPKDPGMSFPDGNSTPGDVFGTGIPSGYDPVSGQFGSGGGGSVWDSLQSVLNSGGGQQPQQQSGGGFTDWLKNFVSGDPSQGGLSGLGPYAAVGAIGISQAKSAQNEASKQADKLNALGKPYTDAGKQLLTQYQSGQLRPEQQAFVDTSSKFSSDLMQAASPLQQIAQSAFADYNSGKLNAADETRLQNQTASRKQQVRQMLSNSGITDSSVLAAQDQQIDNQAMLSRQDLLDKRFATGNSAYDQWLKTTSEGQQLKLAGQKFASDSFEQLMSNALGLASTGMQPAMEAIQLKIQSDAELSQTVSELLGNLAAAYSYAAAGPNKGGGSSGGGGGGGSGGSSLASIISGVGSIAGTVGKLFGFEGAGGQAAGLQGAAGAVGGIYGGLQQQGASGFSQVAKGASSLGNTLADSGLLSDSASNWVGASSTAIGKVAAPLAVAGAIKDWKPGDVKGDTLRGAEAGASVGSVVPVVGTVIGGVVGAALGALSSLMGHKESDSHKVWEKYKTSIPDGTPGSQIPPEIFEEAMLGAWQSNQKALDTFTKMNTTGMAKANNKHGGDAEGFKGWMVDQLAQAVSSGSVKQGMSSDQVFSSVIAPAMDKYWKDTGSKMNMATWQQKYPEMVQIVTQLTDRAMSGQQIDRYSENYKGKGKAYKDVPSLQEAVSAIMSKKTIQPVMGASA